MSGVLTASSVAASTLVHSAVAHSAVFADDDTDKGSPIGLFVVILLVVAVYFLYRSMSRHVKKIPSTFMQTGEVEPPASKSGAGPGSAATGASSSDLAVGTTSAPEAPAKDIPSDRTAKPTS